MAIELRHSARTVERSEPSDPMQTGPRARLTDLGSHADDSDPTTSVIERPSERPGSQHPDAAAARRGRVTRPSMRPSAFGMPRSSAPPGSDREAPVYGPRTEDPRASGARGTTSGKSTKRESSPPRAASTAPLSRGDSAHFAAASFEHDESPRFERSPTEEPGDSPGISQTVQVRPRVTAPPPAVKTDIEQLLPISQGVKSLPRPPRLPSFEPIQPMPAPRRFPWVSLAVFVVVLAASLAPLFHYRGERKQAEPEAPLAGASAAHQAVDTSIVSVVAPLPDVSSLRTAGGQPYTSTPVSFAPSPVERIERGFWGEPARAQQALLAEGERALRAGDERLAETLFARARDFDRDDAQGAYGLARVRLAQGDLDAAEGWVLVAIRQRPRRTEYRALHAEILQRLGRGAEAPLPRTLAR